MPAVNAAKRARAAAPASGGGIGALPDELLQHVLSFLPAQQAVRTCVLARRWVHLWKSATGLRVVGADGAAPADFDEVREFVDSLLLLRGRSPLETFELRVTGDDVSVRRLRLWVSYAVLCEVKVLRVSILGCFPVPLGAEDPPLASRHLTNIQLRGLVFHGDFLDFSRCPALRSLQIEDCVIPQAGRISSQSLRHLRIRRCRFSKSSHARIHAPNLYSLFLHVAGGKTPVLESMPFLVWAIVITCGFCCDRGNCGGQQDDSSCLLLQGTSEAKSLHLASKSQMYVVIKDLKWCPTFSRLKSLLLTEYWCVPDVHGLACILEHSPVLEDLRLLLFSKLPGLGRPLPNVEMIGRFNPKELPPTVSAHLKRVQVICGAVDERVLKVLKFLSKLSISFSFKE
ncbi:hypothetical protein BS78_05G105200 [Paspalum vaginatum]|nr:hypothetical protein BS78_05G105200 [Paspalum vaginatum]KAJ1275022.1 hypothetical protein BS78_05G105200 [Paspalum vaginatum]KAJ1275023.1 hypothetical protein BS78_05G105200 [Paspalum vaginatum]KAJ1275024.1 hypothetical protein BS78_05G105200 [Paspalum vaginatum]